MTKEHKTYTVLAVFFILVLLMGSIRNDPFEIMGEISSYLHQDIRKLQSSDALSPGRIEKNFTDSLVYRNELIDISGRVMRIQGMRDYYSDKNIYITSDDYIIGLYPETATDYEYEQTMALSRFLKDNGINLIYVNEPVKYSDDIRAGEEFGLETYSNRNADKFLSRIREAGINVIDLRDNASEEGIDVKDLFYRTDHHWTVPAGLWASRIMARGLNEYAGYDIDLSVYDDSNYEFTEYRKCWLGEQGRMAAATRIGLDDYTEVKPVFETAYRFKDKDGDVSGTFDDFITEDIYNSDSDLYSVQSWHYSYDLKNCINDKAPYGKLLMLTDSYDNVTEPFLSLGVHETDVLQIRYCDSTFDLKDYILRNGYDTVMISYAQFMIGAHDNPESANYKMFMFE